MGMVDYQAASSLKLRHKCVLSCATDASRCTKIASRQLAMGLAEESRLRISMSLMTQLYWQ